MIWGYIFFAWLCISSVITFILYAIDKKKAEKGKWRIRESTLLLWGFLGGSIGAMTAMRWLRHKTKHWYFWVINFLGFLIQLLALLVLFTYEI